MPCPPPQITRSAALRSSSWRPSPIGCPRRYRPRRRPPSLDTTTRDPAGSVAPGVNASSASSASPAIPVVAVDGATTTTGPSPSGMASTADVGSKCSGPTTTASVGQSGRGTSRAGRVAIRRRSGPGSRAGSPSRPAPRFVAGRRRAPSGRSVARSTVSRSRPRSPIPGANPLPTGGSPFDGRYSGCGLSSTHGTPRSSAASPPHAVITSDTTRSGAISFSCGRVEQGHSCGPPVDLVACVGVVVRIGRIQAEEFGRVHPGGTGGIEPLGAREQGGVVTGGLELQAQRQRGKGVPRVGSGDHRDAHPPTLATAMSACAKSRRLAMSACAKSKRLGWPS